MREIRYALGDRSVRGGLWALLASVLVAIAATAYWWPAADEHEKLQEKIADQRREIVRNQRTGRARLRHAQSVGSTDCSKRRAPCRWQVVGGSSAACPALACCVGRTAGEAAPIDRRR